MAGDPPMTDEEIAAVERVEQIRLKVEALLETGGVEAAAGPLDRSDLGMIETVLFCWVTVHRPRRRPEAG